MVYLSLKLSQESDAHLGMVLLVTNTPLAFMYLVIDGMDVRVTVCMLVCVCMLMCVH